MEDITRLSFWLGILGAYLACILALPLLLKLKAGSSMNFRTLALLVIWIVNVVFCARICAMAGARYDVLSGKYRHYEGIGLCLGFLVGVLCSWLMSAWIVRAFYNPTQALVKADTFSFPGLAAQRFPVYIHRHYILFVLCLAATIFLLPLLLFFLSQKGYLDFISPQAPVYIAKTMFPLMALLALAGIRWINPLFRAHQVIEVNAYGISLVGAASDMPVVSLLWSDIEGFRFKVSATDGFGVLVAYAGSQTLLQLNCWGRARKSSFIPHNELRPFTDFLKAMFPAQDQEEKFVFSWAIAAGGVTEIRNKYYRKAG